MFEISCQGKEISRLFVNFIKVSVLLVNLCEIRKSTRDGNCAAISLIDHFMQLFSIFYDAFSNKSIDISHNLA